MEDSLEEKQDLDDLPIIKELERRSREVWEEKYPLSSQGELAGIWMENFQKGWMEGFQEGWMEGFRKGYLETRLAGAQRLLSHLVAARFPALKPFAEYQVALLTEYNSFGKLTIKVALAQTEGEVCSLLASAIAANSDSRQLKEV